jgi:hypothetical protein
VKTDCGLEGACRTAAAEDDARRSRVQQRHAAHQARLVRAVNVVPCSRSYSAADTLNRMSCPYRLAGIEHQLVPPVLRPRSRKTEANRAPSAPPGACVRPHRWRSWPEHKEHHFKNMLKHADFMTKHAATYSVSKRVPQR